MLTISTYDPNSGEYKDESATIEKIKDATGHSTEGAKLFAQSAILAGGDTVEFHNVTRRGSWPVKLRANMA